MAYSFDPTRPHGNHGAVLRAIEIRKIQNRMLFPIIFLLWSAQSMASEDDKNAGICAGYLASLQKSNTSINAALGLADNPRRALGIGQEWIRQSQRGGASMAIAVEGDRACKRIGIRPVDMR